MKRAIRQLILCAAVLVALVALHAAPAAASWQQVHRDCILNEGLRGSYTKGELQEAKRHVTGERLAYTECLEEISAAIAAAGDRPGSGGGGDAEADLNGDGVVTPAEKRKAKRKEKQEAREIASINDTITPDGGIGAVDGDDSSGGLGAPLLIALILLALAAAAGGLWYAAQRNPAIANALRRVPLPGRRG